MLDTLMLLLLPVLLCIYKMLCIYKNVHPSYDAWIYNQQAVGSENTVSKCSSPYCHAIKAAWYSLVACLDQHK